MSYYNELLTRSWLKRILRRCLVIRDAPGEKLAAIWTVAKKER